jgi:hypothetical protein
MAQEEADLLPQPPECNKLLYLVPLKSCVALCPGLKKVKDLHTKAELIIELIFFWWGKTRKRLGLLGFSPHEILTQVVQYLARLRYMW